jgi:hypothetical protein
MSVSSVSGPTDKTNPFSDHHDAPDAAFSSTALQLLTIHNHVDEILDLKQPNYTTWNIISSINY